MQTDFMHEAFDSDPKHHFSLTTVLQGPQHKMCWVKVTKHSPTVSLKQAKNLQSLKWIFRGEVHYSTLQDLHGKDKR